MSEGCAQDRTVIPDDVGYVLLGLVGKVKGENVVPSVKDGAFGIYLENIKTAMVCESCFFRMPKKEMKIKLDEFNNEGEVYALQSSSWNIDSETHLLGYSDDEGGPAEMKLKFISGEVAKRYFPKALEMII